MKLLAGLGNPGPQYKNTRHNLGFVVLDMLADKLGVRLDREKHHGLMAEAVWRQQRLLLVKPMTYMNLSGQCIADAARNKTPDPTDILVIVDDINLPLGRLRFRAGGGAGGHNGLKSIIERVGSNAFHRLRLGVGQNSPDRDLADYVLSRFRPDEIASVNDMVSRAAEAALAWVSEGIEPVMNQFN